MKKHWVTIVAFAALATAAAWIGGVSAEESRPTGLAPLSWLSGEWRGTLGSAKWEACYTSTDGDVMLSANKQYLDGRVNVFEFEHFAVKDGKVVLTLFHGGKKGPSYAMDSHDVAKRLAVFVNEAEDFPREIRYHRATDEQLLIDVIGTKREKELVLRLDLKRQD